MAISLVVLEALALSVEGFDNKTDGNIITGGVKRVNINGFVYLDSCTRQLNSTRPDPANPDIRHRAERQRILYDARRRHSIYLI